MKPTEINDFIDFQPDFCPVCNFELNYLPNNGSRIFMALHLNTNATSANFCAYENSIKDNIHHEFFVYNGFFIENYRTFRQDYNPKKYSVMIKNYKIVASFPDTILNYDIKKLDKLILLT
jgi:hypothetical protein